MKTLLQAMPGICLCSITAPAHAAGATERVRNAVLAPAGTFFAANPDAVAVSIGVCQARKAYTFKFGRMAPGAKETPTAETLYAIGSITKTFTGALLAQAQIDGKLNLDDDIRKYLDGDYPNLEFEGHPIRIVDLVNHRSGLPFFMPERAELLPDFVSAQPMAQRVTEILAHYSREDFYSDLHKVRLDSIPGQGFRYSNAGAMLAGYIVERIYGESYESLLKRKVLKPIGMRNTTITLSSRQSALQARGFHGSGLLMPDNPAAVQGAGALKSSVHDLLRYVGSHIRERDASVKLSHHAFVSAGNYPLGLTRLTTLL